MASVCVSLFKPSHLKCLEIPCVCKRKIKDFIYRLKQSKMLNFYIGLTLYNLSYLGVVTL